MRRSGQNRRGLTLVEMVVYVGILALILVGVISMVLAVGSTFSEIQATRQLNRSALLVLETFTREVQDAALVDVAGSVFDTHPGELALEYEDGSTSRFYVDGSTVGLDRNGVYEGDLTADEVTVESFIVRHITASPISEAVRLEITLSSTSGSGSAAETFYTTAVARGSYAAE